VNSLVGITVERPLGRILLRGWRRRCPCCGHGPMMRSYLNVRPHCTVCREDLRQTEGNDVPIFLTIILIALIMVPLSHVILAKLRPDPLILLTGFAVGCAALGLYILPRLKGIILAYHWAKD